MESKLNSIKKSEDQHKALADELKEQIAKLIKDKESWRSEKDAFNKEITALTAQMKDKKVAHDNSAELKQAKFTIDELEMKLSS